MKSLRTAIGHFPAKLHDIEGNMAQAREAGIRAAADGARLILLPEGCLTGNALHDPDRQAALEPHPDNFTTLINTASKYDIAICAGFAMRNGNDLFTLVHAAILPNKQVVFQHKAFRARTEPPFLTPWPDPQRRPFTVDGVRIVIAICSELGAPTVNPAIIEAAPQLLLHPSAGCMPEEQVAGHPRAKAESVAAFDASCREVVERAAAKIAQTGIPRIGANPIGFDGETWWPGNSYAVTAEGRIALWLPGENHPDRMLPRVGTFDMPIPQFA